MPHVHTKEHLILYMQPFFNCLTYPEKKNNNNYNCIHLLILDISFNKSCVFIYTCIYICICTLNTSRCCGHCFTVFFFPFFFLGVNLVKLLDIWYILGFEGKNIGRLQLHLYRRPLFLMQTSVYDLDVYETHLTTLYTYIKFSAFLYPSYVHVLPIAKRHCGIFLCHSILHVALHKHFVLTNGHVFFFFGQF